MTTHPQDPIAGFLNHNWFMYPFLTAQQREVVLRFTRGFCASTEFWFSPGIEASEELTWLVGANAALVGGSQATHCFADVRWVYLLGDGDFDDDLSGDARGRSTVRLNAIDLVEESLARIPGQQVAIHEFAHILDGMLGVSDSTPALREALERHLDNRRRGLDDIIPDAVFEAMIEEDSRLEFFAYVSESFFTDPHGVRDFYPPLYDDLVAIYGLDPVAQMPRLEDP